MYVSLPSEQQQCMNALTEFYRSLLDKWTREANNSGNDINSHLRSKGKAIIVSDMRADPNWRLFCPCFRQLYNFLNSRPVDAITYMLGWVSPYVPLAKDVLDLIASASVEACDYGEGGAKALDNLTVIILITLGFMAACLILLGSKS